MSTRKLEEKRDKIEEVSKSQNLNAYLKIIGTEPFWNIEIAEDKIAYTSIDGLKIEFPYNIPKIDKTSDIRTYKTVNGNGTIEIKLTKEICSDGISAKVYDYRVEVEMVQLKKITKLKGCGYFIAKEALSGKWTLTQLKSKKIDNNGSSVVPFIEFDVENNRISGNAGCNGLSSNFYLKNDFINFNEISLTRLYCENLALEQDLANSLNEVSTYRVEGNYLKFYKNGFLEMVFERETET